MVFHTVVLPGRFPAARIRAAGRPGYQPKAIPSFAERPEAVQLAR
jgi:hypothetical protein